VKEFFSLYNLPSDAFTRLHPYGEPWARPKMVLPPRVDKFGSTKIQWEIAPGGNQFFGKKASLPPIRWILLEVCALQRGHSPIWTHVRYSWYWDHQSVYGGWMPPVLLMTITSECWPWPRPVDWSQDCIRKVLWYAFRYSCWFTRGLTERSWIRQTLDAKGYKMGSIRGSSSWIWSDPWFWKLTHTTPLLTFR